MFASIRIYRGAGSKPEILERVEAGFVPILKGTAGFRGWQVVDSDDGRLVSICMFDREEEAVASNVTAANWIRDNIAALLPDPPDVITGELVRSATLGSGLR